MIGSTGARNGEIRIQQITGDSAFVTLLEAAGMLEDVACDASLTVQAALNALNVEEHRHALGSSARARCHKGDLFKGLRQSLVCAV